MISSHMHRFLCIANKTSRKISFYSDLKWDFWLEQKCAWKILINNPWKGAYHNPEKGNKDN